MGLVDELDLALLLAFSVSKSLECALIRFFNLEVVAEDVSHQRPVVQELRMLLTEVSPEVVVGSPEVEGLGERAEQAFRDDVA